MLETYALSGDKRILKRVLTFAESNKFKQLVEKWSAGKVPYGHGVIFYENVRIPALLYPWTGDEKMLKATQQSLDTATQHHGLPMGLVSSEEFLAGIGPTRHVEACNVACAGWTYGWMVRYTGERRYADLMERILFNAAGATIARDYQTMAYYHCPNQMKNFPREDPGPGGNSKKKYHRTAGDVLCCVGNSARIIPNYIMDMWMTVPNGGVAAVLYGPSRLKTETINGTGLIIESKTAYPFEETIRMRVMPDVPVEFPLHLRIPTWCKKPVLRINGKLQPVQVDARGFVKIVRLWQKDNTVTLKLPMQVTVVRGRETPFPKETQKSFWTRSQSKLQIVDNPFAYVNYGPLLFALPIPDKPSNTEKTGAKWNYALDLDPLTPDREASVIRRPISKKWHWQLDAPVKLRVPVRIFDWKPTEQQPLPKMPIVDGEQSTVTLVPYGCTKLRVSMFPVTSKTWGQGVPISDPAGKRE